jgi:hypothetical protein
MEDSKLRISQTMITINQENEVVENTLKTSHSSPSALHSTHKSRPKMGIKSTNYDSRRSSPSLGSLCNCECRPADFENTKISPDEIKHEIVKILSDVEMVEMTPKISATASSSRSSDSPYSNYSSIRARTLQSKYSFLYENNHMTAAAKYQPVNIIKETMIGALGESDKENEKKTSEKERPIPPSIQLNGLIPYIDNDEECDELI